MAVRSVKCMAISRAFEHQVEEPERIFRQTALLLILGVKHTQLQPEDIRVVVPFLSWVVLLVAERHESQTRDSTEEASLSKQSQDYY